jgi:hypothetical protein
VGGEGKKSVPSEGLNTYQQSIKSVAFPALLVLNNIKPFVDEFPPAGSSSWCLKKPVKLNPSIMAEVPRLVRIRKHLKEIFTTGEGQYINEHGESVYGKLPRSKVENPIRTVMRPTLMSEHSNVSLAATRVWASLP